MNSEQLLNIFLEPRSEGKVIVLNNQTAKENTVTPIGRDSAPPQLSKEILKIFVDLY